MLTTEKRVEIILLCGRKGYSQREVAAEFNQRHPERQPVLQSTASRRLLDKFKMTRNVVDAPRSGRPKKRSRGGGNCLGRGSGESKEINLPNQLATGCSSDNYPANPEKAQVSPL